MARITVEDCIDKFPSRFELVLVASNRARKLYSGEKPTVDIDNDKNTVIALREIADETLTKDQLKNNLIEEYQTSTFTEDDISENEDNINDNSEANETNITEKIETNIDEDHVYKKTKDQSEANDQLKDEESTVVLEDNPVSLSDEYKE